MRVLVVCFVCVIKTFRKGFEEMKKFLILLILLLAASCSHARIRESSFLFDDSGTLHAFYIGDKLCDWREEDLWDKTCEDFIFEDIFGKEWRGIKKMLFVFQKAVAEKDSKYLEGYLTHPVEVSFHYEDNGFGRKKDGKNYTIKVNNLSEFKSEVLDKIPEYLVEQIKNAKYKDIYCPYGENWINPTGEPLGTQFRVADTLDGDYIPKIDRIIIDFKWAEFDFKEKNREGIQ